jgi:pimeloyl-ACP methyl ester carboxylesterase
LVKKEPVITVLVGISVLLMVVGGFLGYSTMLSGVKIRYSSVISYDDTPIAIMIVEPDESNNRFGNEKYGVVVAHGVLGKAESNMQMIIALARAGFTVVALDERGHGNSGGAIEKLNMGKNEYKDVTRCAVFLIEELNCKKVSLVGHSLGGMAVSRAATWAVTNNIINVSGTVSISTPFSGEYRYTAPESLNFFVEMFRTSFSFNFSIEPYSDFFNESTAPYNYLSIISEADELIPVNDAMELCELAGGIGHTSDAEFLIGNASDFLLVDRSNGAPFHGDTTKHPLVVQTTIDWIEKSMGLTEPYQFNSASYLLNTSTWYYSFLVAQIGLYLLLFPLYSLVKQKILSINHKRSVSLTTVEKIEEMYDLREFDSVIDFLDEFGRYFSNKDIAKMLGVGAITIFISPFISVFLNLPVLQNYAGISVLVRDLAVASIIFMIIFFLVFKVEKPAVVFNKRNLKKLVVSMTAAGIMLFVFLIGMMLFSTYFDINYKWTPFTFNPFIPERLFMFITFLLELLFAMIIMEFFCRVLIQVNLFNSWRQFGRIKWIKVVIFNAFIKAIYGTLLMFSIYIANDPSSIEYLFTFSLFSIYTIFIICLVIFTAVDGALTIFYQHSKDFWFVTFACYFLVAWFIGSWLIRI